MPENAPILRFELSTAEKMNPFGLRLKAHYEKELEKLRRKNDAPGLGQHETAVIRGNIQFLKGFLALWDEPPPQVATAVRPRTRVDLGAKYG